MADSVWDARPKGYEGDLVADETIYDVAKSGYGDGMRDDLQRSAVPMAALYRRQEGVVRTDSPQRGVRETTKMAWGIGVTALVRVGAACSIRSATPVTIAVAFGPPTSGSVAAVETCLVHAEKNGLTIPAVVMEQRVRRRAPYLTTDMGYNTHNGWAELMRRYGFHPIGRCPRTLNVVTHLEPARATTSHLGLSRLTVPSTFPAALDLATPPLVRRGTDIANDGNKQHDERLANLLPLLMGTNSRVRTAAPRAGRPRNGEERADAYEIDLVCPAVQGGSGARSNLSPWPSRASSTGNWMSGTASAAVVRDGSGRETLPSCYAGPGHEAPRTRAARRPGAQATPARSPGPR